MCGRSRKTGPRPGRYGLHAVATVLCLSLTGSLQLGFQDLFYENASRYLSRSAGAASGTATDVSVFPDTQPTEASPEGPRKEFQMAVEWTFPLFHAGAAVGSLFFGLSFLRWYPRSSLVGTTLLALLTGMLTFIGEVLPDFYALTVLRTVFGACVGYLICVQVTVFSDLALDDNQLLFNFYTALAVPVGSIVALIVSAKVLFLPSTWYIGHLVSLSFVLVCFVYAVFLFRNPPAAYLFVGARDPAMAAALHYHHEEHAADVLAQTQEKLTMRPATPSIKTVWSDAVARPALVLALVTNIAAGLGSDRYTWLFVSRFMAYQEFSAVLRAVVVSLMACMACLGTIVCVLVLRKLERKHVFVVSACLLAVLEIGFSVALASQSSNWGVVAVLLVLRCAILFTFNAGIGFLSFFVPVDLAFGGAKIIVLALAFGSRMLAAGFFPYVFALLSEYSPFLASSLFAVGQLAAALFVALRFPAIHSCTPGQVLGCFGYSMTIEATPEEVADVRQNLHKLWSNPKEE